MSMGGKSQWVVAAGLVLTVMVAAAAGQWPSDPAVNLAVADRPNDQVQPKICATSDGGCYISWFDNATGGYDVYLQRLSAAGYEQWPHNGVLVANRSYSSTTDYGLAVDADDNAILAYNDDRGGSDQIGCNKVAPDGTLLWGAMGVLLTNTTEFVASPKVAVTTQGDYAVAWLQNDSVWMQRLSAAGVPQWNPAKYVTPSSGSYLFSDVQPSLSGTFIVSWVYYTGGYTGPKYLYAQRYSTSGTSMWGLSPVIVFDGGSLQNGYFPSFLPDGAGGAVFAWYDVAGTRNCYVQRVNATGGQVFPHNGVAVSTLANRIRLSPCVTYNSASQEIFTFWTESNTYQTQWGLYGQRFSAAGARLWTNSGLQVLPLSELQNGFLQTMVSGTGATLFYVDDDSDAHLKATCFDASGATVWPNSPRMVSSLPTSKWDANLARTPSGMGIIVWADERDGTDNLYAQNVNADGSLGVTTVPGDLNCDGSVDFGDINPFVMFLSDFDLWQTTYAGCPAANGDINGDGTFPSFADINPFVMLLTGSS
jgi:hypothetical protein